jgi:hypothetical protein
MARSGFTTTDYLSVGVAVRSAAAFSISAWIKTPTLATDQQILAIQNSTPGNDRISLRLYGTDLVGIDLQNGSGTPGLTASAITADTWYHVCGVVATTPSRICYLNGVAGTANTSALPTLTLNTTNVGISRSTTVNSPFLGSIAEIGVWAAALTAPEVLALASGVNPRQVRPQSLFTYWPLYGSVSPEISLLNASHNLTITGTLAEADHPPINNSYRTAQITT